MEEESKRTSSSLTDKTWFPVDNAGTLYAAARRKNWTRTFRVSAVLDEDVEPDVMQQALRDIIPRFPSFRGMLRDGVFWSYFERTDAEPLLQKETEPPYRPIPIFGTDQPNFRVLYYGRRLSVEAFHALCDGGAASVFLSSLLARYYELKGETIDRDDTVLWTDDTPLEAETCDAYRLHADPSVRTRTPEKREPYFVEQEIRDNYARVISGIFRVSDLKTAAAKYECTVTEYLSALLIYCFLQTAKKPVTQDIVVSVPIDLRRRFGTNNMRNFVYMTPVAFDPQGLTDLKFEEIATAINGILLEASNPQVLLDEISANVSAQSSKLLRLVPYPLKRAFLKNTYRQNQRSHTIFFSNLGILEAPAQVLQHIERAEFILGETPHLPFGCAALSVNDWMTFSFCNANESAAFQKEFFRFLSADGVPLRVESNLES